MLDSASETRRDCREWGSEAYSPALNLRTRIESIPDRPSASTLIHTHWGAPGAPGYTPPHTAPSHIHTQAHPTTLSPEGHRTHHPDDGPLCSGTL